MMIIVTEDDRNFINARIPQANERMQSNDVNDILDAIDVWLIESGFAPPDYYDYNDEGRKMQRVRDRIYEDNVLGA